MRGDAEDVPPQRSHNVHHRVGAIWLGKIEMTLLDQRLNDLSSLRVSQLHLSLNAPPEALKGHKSPPVGAGLLDGIEQFSLQPLKLVRPCSSAPHLPLV